MHVWQVVLSTALMTMEVILGNHRRSTWPKLSNCRRSTPTYPLVYFLSLVIYIVFTFIHMHKYMHTYSTYVHSFIHTYIHTYIPYMHTYIHTYIRMYVHSYIHININIYIHSGRSRGPHRFSPHTYRQRVPDLDIQPDSCAIWESIARQVQGPRPAAGRRIPVTAYIHT